MNRFVLISGCSGGGKSTLLAELRRRGCSTVPEPGRRVIAEERAASGTALPWLDLEAFAERALATALRDHAEAAMLPGTVFFDRGLIDAAAALEHVSGRSIVASCAHHRYDSRVFVAPPWPEIYEADQDRRHGIESALAEYDRLLRAFDRLGYDVVLLPKMTVAERADFVLDMIRSA